MRLERVSTAAFAFSLALASSRSARAQVDVNPPLPNVLLLVDTSGSMEYDTSGHAVTCAHVDSSLTDTTGTSQKNRWTNLLEVLTGTFLNYDCYTQDRRSTAFRTEFKLGTYDVPDYNYTVPYHRVLSNGCAVGPGIADSNAFAWGTTPFRYHLWNTTGTSCTGLQQSSDGLLDAFRDRARFGLMTFDTQTSAGTGISSGTAADYSTGTAGSWSYFLNWQSNPSCPISGSGNPSCALGKPAGCSTLSPIEVGARNGAAPPWEGRMMPFGSYAASLSTVHQNTDRIKQVLLAARPFGATPINGMLADARDFLTQDTSDDPTGLTGCSSDPSRCFGPKSDPYITGGCRKNFVILLTDGAPNLDLRPSCEASGGQCPYPRKPEDIVYDLAHPSSSTQAIQTFVVGFAVSSVDLGGPTPIDCSAISTAASGTSSAVFDPNNYCGSSMNSKMSACCTLAKIAFNGGTTNAHFASNAVDLRSAMGDILSQISNVSTSRTVPVFGSGQAGGGYYTFYSSFVVASGQLWKGNLTRQRTICVPVLQNGVTTTQPQAQTVDASKGDDFAANVNGAPSDPSHPRHYYTEIATTDSSGNVWSDRSIRPNLVNYTSDGVGARGGTRLDGTDSTFPSSVGSAAMQITKAACANNTNVGTDANCATQLMKWEIGLSNTSGSTALPDRVGNLFGDIYHASPALVGPPGESLRDESYTAYAASQATRPLMLYAPTNDGQLHAFKVASNDPSDTFTVNSKVQNELWSFFPPAVLPRIVSQYYSSHQQLLDGPPVVKEVVFTRSAQAAESGGSASLWHTVLVEGFGAGGGGYFALDITNPVPTNSATTGPVFLWQLTTDANGNRLFGTQGGTPAITTLYFDPNSGGTSPQEYAVAILPGGQSGAATGTGCAQNGATALVDPAYPPRSLSGSATGVQCWGNDPARSVTVVRLDTGEIVRTFRIAADGPAAVASARAVDGTGQVPTALLDAPMVGQPVVYPAQTGSVADRAFIGDADGMIWRLDLSSTSPASWSINLWFDAYNKTVGTYPVGQPVQNAPVLSVDSVGNVTLAFSTGDQELFNYTSGMRNFLYSLKENPSSTPPFQSQLQWFDNRYLNGARVSGPIQIYSSVLYYTVTTPISSTDLSNICHGGSSQLCAVHYLLPKDSAGTGNGGLGELPADSSGNQAQCQSLSSEVAFGATIVQQPTCSTDQSASDPWLGTSQHTSLGTTISGGTSSVVVNGASVSGGTQATSIALTPPTNTTRIDSWAAVIGE